MENLVEKLVQDRGVREVDRVAWEHKP